ncbi:MAG: LysM peptidoglycan-binding domain-containing protein [Candidatus Omnitrophica bacterium]|nr:LysM peptidoglycan-binding domain-containing protein [Candidatus Omnitrophota bacterium]
MLNKTFIVIIFFAIGAVCSGCVSVNARLEDRARVDQDIPGMPSSPVKTRQVIVVEVNEKVSNADVVKKMREEEMLSQGQVVTQASDAKVIHDSNFTLPGKTSLANPLDASSIAPQEYKVEKDDTLQKVSKKFYGSYSQWTRIYDANKDVIKNPNFVKPGTMLKIPVEGILVDKSYPPAKSLQTDH